MLEGFLGRSKDVVEGSPSLTESALENQESGGGMRQMVLASVKLKSQPKVVSMVGLANSGTGIKRATTVENVESGGHASKMRGVGHERNVQVLSDNDAGEMEAPLPQSPQWKVAERGVTTPTEEEKTMPMKESPNPLRPEDMGGSPPSTTDASMASVVVVPFIAEVADPPPSPPTAEDSIDIEVPTKVVCVVHGRKIPGNGGRPVVKE